MAIISTTFFLLTFPPKNSDDYLRRLLDEPVCHNCGGHFGRKVLPGHFGRKLPGLLGDNYLGIIVRKMRHIRGQAVEGSDGCRRDQLAIDGSELGDTGINGG
jgi:hypothetical protein